MSKLNTGNNAAFKVTSDACFTAQNNAPLVFGEIHTSVDTLNAFAGDGGTSYEGQKVTLIDSEDFNNFVHGTIINGSFIPYEGTYKEKNSEDSKNIIYSAKSFLKFSEDVSIGKSKCRNLKIVKMTAGEIKLLEDSDFFVILSGTATIDNDNGSYSVSKVFSDSEDAKKSNSGMVYYKTISVSDGMVFYTDENDDLHIESVY